MTSTISKDILIKKCNNNDIQDADNQHHLILKVAKNNYNNDTLFFPLSITPETAQDLIRLGKNIYNFVITTKLKNVTIDIDLPDQKITNIIFGFFNSRWKYTKFKKYTPVLENVYFKVINPENFNFHHQNRLINSINFAKELIYTPSNEKYPEKLSNIICNKITHPNLNITILEEQQMETLGMHMLLGVACGSIYKPRMLIIKKGINPKIAIVGKGITFDTGGISLKPSKCMDEMISDMTGTAVTAAVAEYMKEFDCDFYCICVIAENMIGDQAQRPGDIVTSMSGKTAQILNTDAEGRLILGDAVTYAQDILKVETIVTIATLTGAAQVCLGVKHGCLMTNNDCSAKSMINAGIQTGETVWRLPMGVEYDDLISCEVADVQNISGEKKAGTIAGAKFIEAFIDKNKTNFIHLDIANVSKTNNEYIPFGINLLSQFLLDNYKN